MSTRIYINSKQYEVRIALVEDGSLSEIHIQRPSEKGLIGNIYKGKIVRVLPGMQAAFVDIGLERTGFLYVDDIYQPARDIDPQTLLQEEEPDEIAGKETDSETGETEKPVISSAGIEELLTEGEDILVQVSKEPIGSKGARLTSHITLPGRNLVFLPLSEHIGISRKIEDEETRERLKEKIEKLRPEGTGCIARTVAEYASLEELASDMQFLLRLWDKIKQDQTAATVPSMIYEDLDIIFRTVRDLFTKEVDALIIDSREAYDHLVAFVNNFAPQLSDRITLYDRELPLFEAYSIEKEISRALDKKVWLQSGGYIIIETTEALSVIDVNTGRFVGKNNLNETIFKTNIEAAKEIAYQLRLRNIGGIIIIDFIDMESEADREKLYDYFKEALQYDRSRINILKLSEFGLVQMTRKRSSESLTQTLCEPCRYCSGEGILKSPRTLCYEILRLLSKDAASSDASTISLRVHPRVADLFYTEEHQAITQVEAEIQKQIEILSSPQLHLEKFEIIWNNDE